MDNGSQCSRTQLITGNGIFNTAGSEKFMKEVGLAKCGLSYAVVSIMGPQSSGKSTLLNHLFQTNFRAMDADDGRSQTTQGIWIAKCVGIEPCTLVMDLEGSDGRERGEDDDTTFEKQIALFALAVSDVVLINMWCQDIGREQAGNRPLLKIVLEVMLKLFSQNKTTLMFVIRNKTKTSLEKLELTLREDIQKIWDSIQKPEAHKETPLSDFFNVRVVALCNFEEKEVEFKEQVASLRQRFFISKSPGGLAGDRQGVIPGTAFFLSAQKMWEIIKENKDLDLPSHQVMVATVRCEEIANQKFDSFVKNEDWCQLKESVKTQAVSGFGKRLSSIYDSCLLEYDTEAAYFDDRVRFAKKKELEEKILILVEPAFQSMLMHITSENYEKFKQVFEETLRNGEGFSAAAHFCTKSIMAQFDSRCADAFFHQGYWAKSRNDFQHAIVAYIGEIRVTELAKLKAAYEEKLSEALSECLGDHFNKVDDLTWRGIRSLIHHQTTTAVTEISKELASFDMDDDLCKDNIISSLKDYAKKIVVSKSKDEAGKVPLLMKDRFHTIFNVDSDSGNTDIQQLSQTAHNACLKILVVMAAARLEERADNITAITIIDETSLAWDTWEHIPLSDTLITPKQCRNYWRQFCEETERFVTQAAARQAACLEVAERQAAALEAADRQATSLHVAAREAEGRHAAELQATLREAAGRHATALEAAAREAAAREAATREATDRHLTSLEAAAREAADRHATAHESAAREAADRQAANRLQNGVFANLGWLVDNVLGFRR